MLMRENRAYQRLKRLHPHAHWQRLESWTGTGIFDVNACYNWVEVWVECKQGTIKKDGTIAVNVRPAQIAWEFCRRQAGGRTFVALLLGKELLLLPGIMIKNLNKSFSYNSLKAVALDPNLLFNCRK